MSIITMRQLVLAFTALCLCAASPARADWFRAETAHFVIYGDTSERDIRNYAQKIERFDSFLRTYYPIQVDHEIPKLEIFMANGARDMERAYPGIPSTVAGYYTPNNARIHAVSNTASRQADETMFHEYGHHFMFQMAATAYPSWFVEGFAEYYSTAEIRSDRIQFGRHSPGRMNSLTQAANQWAPLADVLTWRISASGRYRGYDYYAQSWALTHYLMSTPERQMMLRRYLAAVAGGTGSIEAMQAATGRTPEQLQNDIRIYLTGTISVLTPQIQLPTPEVAVTRLTEAEGDLAWLDLRLDSMEPRVEDEVEEGNPDEVETPAVLARREREARERAEARVNLIRDASAGAARHPGDRMAALVEARGLRLKGDPVAAFAVLEPLIASGSQDPIALRLAAEMLMDQARNKTDAAEALADRREARTYLARALEVAPLDFRIYGGLNQSRRFDSNYPSANDISTLEVAVALAPQSYDMRMRLADAYLTKGLTREAIDTALPVANSPHGGGWTRRARALVAAARTAAGQPVEADEAPPAEAAANVEAPVPAG